MTGLIGGGFLLLAVVAVGGLIWWGSTLRLPPQPHTVAEREARNLNVFDAVWGQVDRHYFDRSFRGQDWPALRVMYRARAANQTADVFLYTNVLNAMISRLKDGHVSALLPPEPVISAELPHKGPACSSLDYGLGATWVPPVGPVIDVRKGSPADLAGIEPGSPLLAWSVSGTSCKVVVNLAARSPSGQTRTLRAQARPVPNYSGLEARNLPDGVRLLRFDSFDDASTLWLLDELKHAPPSGVILDLRRNPGGRLIDLQEIAGVLFGPGQALGVFTDAKRRVAIRSQPMTWWRRILMHDHDHSPQQAYRGKLAVLIGPMSASASEVLAETARFHHRGTVVGERSAGSVEQSRNFSLPDGGTVEVAVADYLSPAGYRLEGRGVAPDIRVRQTLAAIRADRDLVVEAADGALVAKP